MARVGGRTVVLGFDGIDANLTVAFMRAGIMPSFLRMVEDRGLRRVHSTTPAESAVAWTCFATSSGPGQTGVFDFICRAPGSYSPRLSGAESSIESLCPLSSPRGIAGAAAGLCAAGTAAHVSMRRVSRRTVLRGVTSLAAAAAGGVGAGAIIGRWLPRRAARFTPAAIGKPWWDRLACQGDRTIALRIPMTFPARAAEKVRLLAGLGVPDVRGTCGSYVLITDAPEQHASVTGHLMPLKWEGDLCVVQIPGPESTVGTARPSSARLALRRHETGSLRAEAAGPPRVLHAGRWSDPLELRFRYSPLECCTGFTRLYRSSEGKGTSIYLSPVEIDALGPSQTNPLSCPPDFAAGLAADAGRFRTIGWETQTAGLVDGVLDDAAYLGDLEDALTANQRQLDSVLLRQDWDNLMMVVQATDQAQHVFFDEGAESARSGGPVDHRHPLAMLYARVDQMADHVRRSLDPRDRLVIISDHGFAPYRKSVNVNSWLAAKGWLALRDGARRDGDSARDVLRSGPWGNVDWFNTRAYGLGLAGVRLNVAGREPQGIVRAGDEYEYLQNKLTAAFRAWRDRDTGSPVLRDVHRRQDIYEGQFLEDAPDIVLGMNLGYRVSSASAVGGVCPDSISINRSRWNGDHCGVDARLVPGICLTTFKNGWPTSVSIETLASRIWPDLPTV
jgi:predicted AlkP superfamily phosphohydrolase/phosphomutase